VLILSLLIAGLYSCTDHRQPDEQNTNIIKYYNQKASDYLFLDADSSIYFAKLALESSKLVHQNNKAAYYYLGYANRLKGNLKEALDLLNLGEQLIYTDKIDSLDGELLLILGDVYTDLGHYDVALSKYHEAVGSFKKIGNLFGQGRALNKISLIYYRIDDIPRAIEFNHKSYLIWKKEPNRTGLASHYTIKGYILARNMEYDSSIYYHQKAQQIYHEDHIHELYANSFLNLGDVYIRKGDYKKAEKAFQTSLELSKNLTFVQIYVDGFNKLGNCYTKQGKYDLAEKTLFQGLKLAKEINDIAMLAEFNMHISELFLLKSDLENAFKYRAQHQVYKDSIFKKERSLRIAEYHVIYQTEQIKAQNRKLEEVNKRRQLYLYFFIILISLIIAFIFALISRYRLKLQFLNQQKALDKEQIRQKEMSYELEKTKNSQLETARKLQDEENDKLQLEIQHKHDELSSVTMHIYQKNENLNQILNEIEKIEERANPENKRDLKRLRQSILQNVNLDEDWNRFKMHFNQVHEGFIDRLAADYESLTNNDLRHCAYIKMNLTTKEISRLMNINPTSVQRSRVRLKKKLKLGQEEDLFDFLAKF
jgi:tetratricopeptide (TPR) repeat protein